MDKIIFLIQVYFVLSFVCTFILLCAILPHEIELTKRYEIKRTYEDNLAFIKNIIILLLFFPIICLYLGFKFIEEFMDDY